MELYQRAIPMSYGRISISGVNIYSFDERTGILKINREVFERGKLEKLLARSPALGALDIRMQGLPVISLRGIRCIEYEKETTINIIKDIFRMLWRAHRPKALKEIEKLL